MQVRDPYSILNVSRGISFDEVKAVFRARAKRPIPTVVARRPSLTSFQSHMNRHPPVTQLSEVLSGEECREHVKMSGFRSTSHVRSGADALWAGWASRARPRRPSACCEADLR